MKYNTGQNVGAGGEKERCQGGEEQGVINQWRAFFLRRAWDARNSCLKKRYSWETWSAKLHGGVITLTKARLLIIVILEKKKNFSRTVVRWATLLFGWMRDNINQLQYIITTTAAAATIIIIFVILKPLLKKTHLIKTFTCSLPEMIHFASFRDASLFQNARCSLCSSLYRYAVYALYKIHA